MYKYAMQRFCLKCSQVKNCRMKKGLFLLLICTSGFLVNCKKDSTSDHVLLRIQNKTEANFTSVVSNSHEFGNINANTSSGYVKFDQIVENPTAFMVAGNDTLVCGLYYYDYIGFIKNGKYTLQIYPDAAAYSGYSCKYIKD